MAKRLLQLLAIGLLLGVFSKSADAQFFGGYQNHPQQVALLNLLARQALVQH